MKDKAATQFTLPTYYHLPTTVTVVWRHSTGSVVQNDTARQAAKPQSVDDLKAAQASIHHLRDGDVVLYKVPRSKYWQARGARQGSCRPFHAANGCLS